MSTAESLARPEGGPSGGAVLAHMVDALAFRYHWATEGLTDAAVAYVPPGGGMGIADLVRHLRDLSWWLRISTQEGRVERGPDDFVSARAASLAWFAEASESLRSMDEVTLGEIVVRSRSGDKGDIWNMIHGPIADALTHVGQLNTLRRMAGNPPPPVEHFAGQPSEASEEERNAARVRHSVVNLDLAGSTYTDVALTGAEFHDVSLAGAKFTDVTFAGATLHDVDLSNVNITDANLEGLRIDGELWDSGD